MGKIINVLCHFWGFVETFSQDRAHNMVALMLDPCFKNMDCIMDYISKDQATTLVQQYDDLIMMPLLKNVMGYLNLVQSTSLGPLALEQPSTSFGLFGSIVPIQEATEGLLKVELFLFCKFHVENVNDFDPLIRWVAKFPNVGFLAPQIFCIFSS
jgi:hypothetical protein